MVKVPRTIFLALVTVAFSLSAVAAPPPIKVRSNPTKHVAKGKPDRMLKDKSRHR